MARAQGARVIATAGSAEKLARARQLGAHIGIDHYQDDIAKEVRVFTDRRGVDVVVEHVGQSTWEQSIKSLRRGGRLVTCGATTGPGGAVDIRHLFTRQISLIGSYMGSKGELLRAADLFFDGEFGPVIDRTYSLEAAAEAQHRLEDQAQFGKIVLEL